ncbi:MAG: 6-phosphofructokinase, partial [Acidobacteriota bacterium]
MKVGVLTGGGDAPGLNAVIRAVVRKGEKAYGDDFAGFADGWRGLIEGKALALTSEGTRGLLPRGGTILGTSRTNPFKVDGGPEKVEATIALLKIDALIAIGGEDTLGVALKLFGR